MIQHSFRILLAPALLASSASAQAPELSHGKVALGSPVVLTVSGAPPAAQVVLFAGTQPGHVDLGFGILEIDPGALFVAAEGIAGPSGEIAFAFPTALDPSAVEAPVHLQAVVLAPGASPVLTAGLHLRLLGSRVYVGIAEAGAEPGRLQAYSAVTDELLFERDDPVASPPSFFDSNGASDDELPLVVRSHDHGRAAYVPSDDRIVVFDDFFGDEIAVVPAADLSRRLHVDPAGETIHALQATPPRILAIDFDTGAVLGTLDLSHPVAGAWTASDVPGRAYVATGGGEGAPVGILRVDLDAMAEIDHVGVLPAAGPTVVTHVDDLGWSGAELLVSARSVDWIGLPPVTTGHRARVTWSGGAPLVELVTHGGSFVKLLVAAELGWALAYVTPATSPFALFVAFPTASVSTSIPFPHVPQEIAGFQAWALDGAGVWLLVSSNDTGFLVNLWLFDLQTGVWTKVPPPWGPVPGCEWYPMDFARVDDAFVNRVFAAGQNISISPDCMPLPDRLFVTDLAPGAPSSHFDLPGRPVLIESLVVH